MVSTVLLFLTVGVVSALAGTSPPGNHSLFFTYTLLSQHLDRPGIHLFIALSIFDGEVFESYNSTSQSKVTKHDWIKTMRSSYNSEKILDKEEDLRSIMKDCMGHDKSEELHILQWRQGCEIEHKDGKITFLKGFDEYGCDGTDFLSFTEENSSWVASVPAAEKIKIKVDRYIMETKNFLNEVCVKMLKQFTESVNTALNSSPKVSLFTTRSFTDSSNLTLTCLATGFYPKDVQIQVRKSKTSLPQHLLTSSGIRHNDDDTYQLRMSVNITEDERELYDCYVIHSTLTEPKIVEAKESRKRTLSLVHITIIGVIVGALIILMVSPGVFRILTRRGNIAWLPIRGTLTNRLLEVMCPRGNGNAQESTTTPTQDENQAMIPMLDKEE